MDSVKSNLLDIIKDVCPPTIREITDLDKPLVDYGLDSLDISGVLLAVEERFGVPIPDEDVDTLTSINRIAAYLIERM